MHLAPETDEHVKLVVTSGATFSDRRIQVLTWSRLAAALDRSREDNLIRDRYGLNDEFLGVVLRPGKALEYRLYGLSRRNINA